MTATTGVGGLIYGRALVDQKTGKKINFDELGGGNIPEDITELIASKAPIESPSFTGNPQAPTPSDDAVGKEITNVEYVKNLIAKLVNSAPETLDTLNELAKALGDDPNFATTVTNALAGKQPLNDVLTAISELKQRADNLLCFNQDGNASLSPLSEKARSLLAQDTVEAMRTELELKAAATMEPQTDIRDRTPGRLAIPGSFGYGSLLTEPAYIASANGPKAFADWVISTPPGKYSVVQMIDDPYENILPTSDPFIGIVEIDIPYFVEPKEDHTKQAKLVNYRSVSGTSFSNYYNPNGTYGTWFGETLEPTLLFNILTQKGNPGRGNLFIAACVGTKATDTTRGYFGVRGSDLRDVWLTAPTGTSGSLSATVGDTAFSGVYACLSGLGSVPSDSGTVSIGLYMRVN